MRVGVFGLGKLGSPMLAVFAAAGHEVVGCDVSQKAVDAINAKQAPVNEPGLQVMLDSAKGAYRATTDADATARWAEILFIIVPTPSKADHTFSSAYVEKVCADIGPAIGETDGYKLIVLTSTVMPGTMEGVIVPILEKASGKKCGVGFGLCYSPEFIALGSVIQNMLHPDFVLIGGNTPSGIDLRLFYDTVFAKHGVPSPHYKAMSFVNAELAKLALNCYITMKISYANEIAALCERVKGADAAIVLGAIGHDSRIGNKYLVPATKFAGPCFPRDSRAMIALGTSVGVCMRLPGSTDKINTDWAEAMEHRIAKLTPEVVAILGLTYKPDTNVAEESAGMALVERLSERHRVRSYDPSLPCGVVSLCGDRLSAHSHRDVDSIVVATNAFVAVVSLCNTARECIDGADVIVITTPWPEFRTLRIDHPCHVFDCWRILDPSIQAEGVVIHYPGRNEK